MYRFDNSGIRRQDRLLDKERSLELLVNGEYGFLSLASTADDGTVTGYGIPVNYVFKDSVIYIHCAPEGKKLEAISKNNRCSFCVVGATKVQPSKFTTAYSSIIVCGEIRQVSCIEEKAEALKLIIEKYAPDYAESGKRYSNASFDRTAVLRIDIHTISGKSKTLL